MKAFYIFLNLKFLHISYSFINYFVDVCTNQNFYFKISLIIIISVFIREFLSYFRNYYANFKGEVLEH